VRTQLVWHMRECVMVLIMLHSRRVVAVTMNNLTPKLRTWSAVAVEWHGLAPGLAQGFN
jgi:hypothetical protein